MVDVQNATLAGGVAIGTAANLHVLSPAEAVIIGCLGGALSVVGYTKIQPKLETLMGVHDTCGVNNLHGMPAILAAVASAVILAYTKVSDFEMPEHAYAVYGKRFSSHINATSGITSWKEDRTPGVQAGYQLLCMLVSFCMAVSGGLVSGWLVKKLGQMTDTWLFVDRRFWEVPELEMPFYFDARGEISRDKMIEEVAHSLHGANAWNSRPPSREVSIDIEDGNGSSNGNIAQSSPNPYRPALSAGPRWPQEPLAANVNLVSNELLSLKLDLVLQQIGQASTANAAPPRAALGAAQE